MNLISEFIKYKLNSKGKHQIHSPFVYDFITKCLKLNIRKEDLITLRNYSDGLKNSKQVIEIKDFGAGSKKLTNKRKISEMYRTSSSKGIYAKLLYQLSAHYNFRNTLEFGTNLGIGTLHLALGDKNNLIHTVEACQNTFDFTKTKLSSIENIHFYNETFLAYIKNIDNTVFDCIFIDGHHDGNALLNYIELLLPYSHDETIFIVDDIRWSNSMMTSWKKLVSNNDFHLSLDLFRMGILVKRKHQAKEDFVVKLKSVLKGMI